MNDEDYYQLLKVHKQDRDFVLYTLFYDLMEDYKENKQIKPIGLSKDSYIITVQLIRDSYTLEYAISFPLLKSVFQYKITLITPRDIYKNVNYEDEQKYIDGVIVEFIFGLRGLI